MRAGEINRSERESARIGGKGINVSLVLKELGIKSRAMGFIAGFTGDAIEKCLNEVGIETDFVHLSNGLTRINMRIISADVTEINGTGPYVSEEDAARLFKKLSAIKDGDTLILSGSVPASLSSDIYEKILEHFSGKKIKAIIDARKDLLLNTLKCRPFLVKPNSIELGEIFGTVTETTESIIIYAGKLKEAGARNVLVSRANDGAVLLDENGKTHIFGSCKGTEKNPVGAGDSMIAGFVAGSESGDYEYALKLGIAAGSATAFSDSLAKREDIYKLLEQL